MAGSKQIAVKIDRRKPRVSNSRETTAVVQPRPPDPASLLPPDPPASMESLDPGEIADVELTMMRPLPKIERMPDGIEVTERPVGHATAQWIVMVRCQCGRRWFEVEFVDTATCPRCGLFVVVELDGGPPPR
jgi:hypothetical protein